MFLTCAAVCPHECFIDHELLLCDILCCVLFPILFSQERAAGALANLAADDKCSMEVALAGGVHALVMLARSCKFEGVQEQVVLFWCFIHSSQIFVH